MVRPRLLIVCTANQCRSAMAEFLFRTALADIGIDWDVASAGTDAMVGLPMDSQALRLLNSRQIKVLGWSTSAVTPAMLRDSDLVLTATRRHRGVLVQAVPDAVTKTFPILQFSRLVSISATGRAHWSPRDSASWPGSLRSLSELARSLPSSAADDLLDPVGQPYRHFRNCARTVDRAIAAILASGCEASEKPVPAGRRHF